MRKELLKAYEPSKYEDGIYKEWEKSGFFNPDSCVKNGTVKKDAPSYSIAMPPPNRTGTLHIGHAVMLAIEDILTRYHRMKGDRTLWVPGTDHAAIATNAKVEKILKKEGTNRHELGREKFLKRVVDFAQESHDTIVNQVKKIGCSCDWSREAYTFDDVREKAVNSVFKMMYDDGLIYRGKRIVNWCPRCHSTLSDDEVEYKEEQGKFYWIKYGPFVLATARPETKLGDTAVAVYPGDKRYKKMVGKEYMIPGVLGKFKVKVIADKSVDPDFGSGAIKVTPAHSLIDNEMAARHGIPMKQIINEDGRMMDNCGKYAGMTTSEARVAIVKDMKKMGLIDHIEDNYTHNISACYRCDTHIEPIPSEQWFIDVNKKIPKYKKTIKELSVEAVKKGVFKKDKINIIPKRFEKNYFHWMENLRDWCISRQIWFGHRVPVWYKTVNSEQRTANNGKVDITYFPHGTTTDNENNISTGWNPGKLSKLGIKQSKELWGKTKHKKFDVVICSDLKRAVDSAELIFKNRVPIIKDRRLRECNYGDLNGEDSKKVEPLKPNHIETSFPNGESYKNVEERMRDFLNDISEKYSGKKVVIISHHAPQLALEVIVKGKTWKQAFKDDWRNHKAWKLGWDYNLGEKEEMYAGVKKPKGKEWKQDEDTLDTWFSSGLWTFSTLASSPDQISIKNNKLHINSDDFKNFHPTNVLETGYDILFFWVARMIVMTTYAVGDIPFQDVYLHGLVRDEKGKKMSKSIGNVIDPLDMIKKYGADATRLSLIIGTTPGGDTNLSEAKIAGYRNFANKLWNVARYILQQTANSKQQTEINFNNLTLADKWILSKLHDSIKQVANDLKDYKFSSAGEYLREFTWNDLADWYLEATKFQKGTETEKVLLYVLRNLLKLWHPFMPFVTEIIWKEFNDSDLIIEKWPEYNGEEAVKLMGDAGGFELLQGIIINIRNARAENRVDNSKKVTTVIVPGIYEALIEYNQELIKRLRTGIKELRIEESGEKYKDEIHIRISNIANNIDDNIDIYLIGAIDKDKEFNRIMKEIDNLKKLISSSDSKLENNEFISKAPKKIVDREKKKLEEAKKQLNKLIK
ncbi:MAG: class I tRNA ligase family protein [Patescibacteria group bacterium]